MSTTTAKRPLAQARDDAFAFRDLFPPACYATWWMAGSVRRGRPEIGDVEHVVVPNWGDIEVATGSLFGTETKRVNLVMHRLDELVTAGTIAKHDYAGQTRWGEKYRGADFCGFCHEVFSAAAPEPCPCAGQPPCAVCHDAGGIFWNFGAILAIRTGPGGFSKMLVNALQRNGYCNDGGFVWNKNDITCSCGWRGTFAGERGLVFIGPEDFAAMFGTAKPRFINGRERAGVCPQCRQQQGLAMRRVPAPTEHAYFELCGLPYVEPRDRLDPEVPQ